MGPRGFKSRRIGAVLCAGAVALACLGAGAVPATATVSNRDVDRAIRVADDYWGSRAARGYAPPVPCRRGSVVANWLGDLGAAMATAHVGGCALPLPTINLETPTIRGLDDDHACGVIVHEYGHLLGYTHNRVKGSIMYGTLGLVSGPQVPRAATWDRAYRRSRCGGL
jgi:Zn-dependent protease with chaperone function